MDLAVNMLHAWAPGAVIFVQNMCASGVHPLHAAIFLHKLLPQAVDLVSGAGSACGQHGVLHCLGLLPGAPTYQQRRAWQPQQPSSPPGVLC